MRLLLFVLLAINLVFSVFACNEYNEEIGNDVEPRVIAGGGTGDGPIDGRLNVITLDDETENPIRGAFVMLSGEPDLTGTTDADGMVIFRGASIQGPQTVTVYKQDYTLATFVGLNAANLTLTLDLVDPGPDPVQATATIKGQVTGFENIAEPPQDSYKLAIVSYTIPDLFEEEFEWIEQAGEPPTNMVVPDLPDQDDLYELKTWVGRQSTTVFGGIITPIPNEDPELYFTHMGIVRNVVTVKDQVQENIDVDMSIPLDQTAELTISGKPSGTNKVTVLTLLDLADDGQALMQVLPGQTADTWTGDLPALSGDLSDGVYHLAVRAYNEVCVGEECEEESPASMIVRRDLTVADLTGASVSDFLPPPGSMSVDTGTLSFSFTSSADVDLSFGDLDDPDENTLWSIILFEPGTDAFQLPELPAEAEFAGLSGTITWNQNAVSIEPGVDPNDFQFDDFSQVITHMASDDTEFTK